VRSELVDDLEDVSETDILFRMNKRDPKVSMFFASRADRRNELAAQNPVTSTVTLPIMLAKSAAAITTDA